LLRRRLVVEGTRCGSRTGSDALVDWLGEFAILEVQDRHANCWREVNGASEDAWDCGTSTLRSKIYDPHVSRQIALVCTWAQTSPFCADLSKSKTVLQLEATRRMHYRMPTLEGCVTQSTAALPRPRDKPILLRKPDRVKHQHRRTLFTSSHMNTVSPPRINLWFDACSEDSSQHSV
jgi:hypothetical protein